MPASRSRDVARSPCLSRGHGARRAGLVAIDRTRRSSCSWPTRRSGLLRLGPAGVIGTVALTVGCRHCFVVHFGSSADAVGSIAVSMGVSLLFSLLLGSGSRASSTRAGPRRPDRGARRDPGRAGGGSPRAGVMAERERFAREIHDTLAQGFTSVVMLAQAAQAQLPRDPAAARSARGHRAHRPREPRRGPRGRRGVLPGRAGRHRLAEALRRLAARFAAETGIAVDVEVGADGLRPGPRPSRWSCCAPRRRRWPTSAGTPMPARSPSGCVVADGTAQVEVSDDGSGFDPAAANGFGLCAACATGSQDVGGTWRS